MKDMRASCLEPVNVLAVINGRAALVIMKQPKMPAPISFLIIYEKELMCLSILYLLHIPAISVME